MNTLQVFSIPALMLVGLLSIVSSAREPSPEPISISGIYPSLAMFNGSGECGTGAVVPWADRLWVITYAPHMPSGSDDKLYEITPDLRQIIRPESIGGTPANRMIHPESNQLFIGPYAIDAKANVRAIPYSKMFGRPTANARHLTDPAGKILYATMEEGIYEVDTKTLEVKELWGDEQNKKSPRKAGLHGYHGKGFYSGQSVYVYANNGQKGQQAKTIPETESGVLAEWDGNADAWKVIRLNQFTDVTGPGGIHGAKNPATDPIWAIGWDYKSLLLGVRMPKDGWTFYRLPKSSHSYDGAHGWNTEWPRIREIGEEDFLMTMHGAFWKFPKTFTPQNSAGIIPRSNYLKVIGDFCRWNDKIVLGCDDAAKSEFLNKRKAKGHVAGPQSQSNLWFIKPEQLDTIGPVIGRGAVWENEALEANTVSDAYLFNGYDHRALHLTHNEQSEVIFTLEIDKTGNGSWSPLKTVTVPATKGKTSYVFTAFTETEKGVWIRIKSDKKLNKVSAVFTYRNEDKRNVDADPIFGGLATKSSNLSGGILRARDGNKRTLSFAAVDNDGKDIGYYEMDDALRLNKVDDKSAHDFTKQKAAIAAASLTVDSASVIYTDDGGNRWRLPKGDLPAQHPLGSSRIAREVATERDLLNAHGTFYELPARNAGGFPKLRAVATHNRLVHDFCSYRGLYIMSGVSTDAPDNNPHIIKSGDGKTAVWAGAIDDIWKLGKPHGKGGPWLQTNVKAGIASDPFIMTGFDKKSLTLITTKPTNMIAQIDLTGTGNWVDYKVFGLEAGQVIEHKFPIEFQAYWIRFISEKDTQASAQMTYQ
jgi:hypothetical protein